MEESYTKLIERFRRLKGRLNCGGFCGVCSTLAGGRNKRFHSAGGWLRLDFHLPYNLQSLFVQNEHPRHRPPCVSYFTVHPGVGLARDFLSMVSDRTNGMTAGTLPNYIHTSFRISSRRLKLLFERLLSCRRCGLFGKEQSPAVSPMTCTTIHVFLLPDFNIQCVGGPDWSLYSGLAISLPTKTRNRCAYIISCLQGNMICYATRDVSPSWSFYQRIFDH